MGEFSQEWNVERRRKRAKAEFWQMPTFKWQVEEELPTRLRRSRERVRRVRQPPEESFRKWAGLSGDVPTEDQWAERR